MVNLTGANGMNNGTRPSDKVLEQALKSYAYKSLSMDMQLLYLEKDYGYKIKHETLCKLNCQFDVPSVRKPPPYPVAKTLVCEKIAKGVSQRNGPRQIQRDLKTDKILIPRDTIRKIVQEEAPEGAVFRDPAGHKKKKVHGHLTGIGVMQETHYDGPEKLGPLALHIGGVGIPIYGMRDHAAGKIQWLGVVPNDRNEHIVGHVYLDFVVENGYTIPLQITVDGRAETGQMYACHHALRTTYLPELDEHQHPTFVALQSTDNIGIESVWSYWLKAKGTTLHSVIMSGNPLHADCGPRLYNNDFKESFNTNPTWYQRDKKLPSGVSPEVVFDFPDQYGLQYLGCKVDPEAVETLCNGLGISREKAFQWVSEEFDALAAQVYKQISCPELECDNGWDIFNKMIHILDTHA